MFPFGPASSHRPISSSSARTPSPMRLASRAAVMVLVIEPISNRASFGSPSVTANAGPPLPLSTAATATTIPSPGNAPSSASKTARARSESHSTKPEATAFPLSTVSRTSGYLLPATRQHCQTSAASLTAHVGYQFFEVGYDVLLPIESAFLDELHRAAGEVKVGG